LAVKDKSVQIVVSAEVKKVLDAFDSAGKGITKFGAETERIGKAIDGAFAPLMKGLTVAVGAITGAMGALAKAALNVGGDFEMTMTRVAGVSSATQEEFAALTEKAEKLGETLPITASQAAEAMYSLSSAGMSAKETLGAIDGVVGLSIAQNYDLAESANLMTATIRGFGLEADQAGRVADVFNNVISSSMMNMQKLNDAMSYVAPVAKSLGISLEDTAAAMGKLADSGLRGEQIGTALRAIMLSLVDPTAEAARELDKLGVTVTDVNGKLRPLDDIFQDLKAAGMDAAEAVRIFDKRSVAAALTLMEVSGSLDEYAERLGKLGRTQELLSLMMDTFVNRVKAVSSAYEATLIEVFKQIEERAGAVADTIRDLILVFNDWARETKIFEKVLNALFEGFGIATGNVELFRQSLESIDVDAVAARFRGFAEGVRVLFDALMELGNTVPWKFIAEHLDKITYFIVTGWAVGKVTLITSSILGLAGVFIKLSKSLYGLAAAQKAVEAGYLFSPAGILSLKAFGVGLSGALALILAFPDALADNADNAELWTEAINGNTDALAKLSEEEQKFIRDKYGVGDKLKDEAKEAEAAVIEINQSYLDFLQIITLGYKNEAEQIEQLVAGFSKEITQALKEGGDKGVKDFLASFGKLPPEMEVLMQKVILAVKKGAEEMGMAGEGAKSFSQSVSEEIQKAITDYQKYAAEMTQKTKELIDTTGINAKEAWALLEQDLAGKAGETSKKLVEQFGNPSVAQAFAAAFDTMAKKAGDAMTFRISDALNSVKSAINEISKEAKGAIDEFLGKLAEAAPAFQNLQLQQVRETVDSIVFMADNGMSKVIRVYDKATGEIKDVAQTLQDTGRDSSKAFDQAANEIDRAGRKTGDAWTDGAIRPLEKTAQTAESASQSITNITASVQAVGDKVSAIAVTIGDAIKNMGDRMVSTLTAALDTARGLFERTGIEAAQRMMDNLNATIRNAIPSLSTTAQYAGQTMGMHMGRAMENAMQQSITNISQAIAALERRIAAAKSAASSASRSGGVDPAALASAYAREG
jgi:TP901 family phage tail tape measure protein